MAGHDKNEAQFWVAVVSVGALAAITAGSLVADRLAGGAVSQVTGLLAGGVISVAAASASWLFRNGNGNGSNGGPAT